MVLAGAVRGEDKVRRKLFLPRIEVASGGESFFRQANENSGRGYIYQRRVVL